MLLFNAYTSRLLSVATSALSHVFVGTKPFGKKLSKKHLNLSVKSFAKACGLQKLGLTGHCTRVGGTTAAFRAGIDRRVVARHGDWKSDAIDLYIEDSIDDITAVSRSI